ncbi:F-box only protein 15-like [Embiotoca jacksoni]|uniref:F-box only protein 15-like n=1 Tax=Embiotoca jacksoni TaxID=100190 RepID=UPI0037040E57
MAAGRGEFFSSLLLGLERTSAPRTTGTRQPSGGRGKPGSARGLPGTGGGRVDRWRRKKEPKERRLPSEILLKILSYLDASSLLCVGHVSKLFHRLGDDDVTWQKIYTSEFVSQTWKPKSAGDEEDEEEEEDRSAGRWKKMYFRAMVGQEVTKWRKELSEISPSTGLPRQTERVLRNLNVSWELTLRDRRGREVTLAPSRLHFFESSVIVRWSAGGFPARYRDIGGIRLHGVRRERRSHETRKPGWRSLMLKLDLKTHPPRFIGADRLVRLVHLSPGFIIGIWRGQDSVAFIMVSLHFHQLVEKSLLGSPVCPYTEPADRLPPADHQDPEFGLHGYTLHFVLHNTGSEIMSGHFRQLSCRADRFRRGLVELTVVNRADPSQHRSLSGSIKLPWKSDALEGSVENCCIMTSTLLDEFQKPFWCVSSPVCVTTAKAPPPRCFDYSGEHFAMGHRSPDGEVRMTLVWLKEQKQFFLVSLAVYVALYKLNERFGQKF